MLQLSWFLIVNYTIKLWSSKQCGISTETDTQMNGTKQRTLKCTHVYMGSYDKEGKGVQQRKDNMFKTSAGDAKQLHAK